MATPGGWPSGIDQNRLSLLLAVLEKRAGLKLLGEDVFINVAGGMTLDEPAADLAVVGCGRVEFAQPADSSAEHGGVRRSRTRAVKFAARRRRRCVCGGGADGIHPGHRPRQ